MTLASSISLAACALELGVGFLALSLPGAPGWRRLRLLSFIAFTASVHSASNLPQPRGGTLTVSTRNVPAGGRPATGEGGPPRRDCVRLTVRDTGGGMSPEGREHLFEPFFTTKPQRLGTGLGLATVHGIVTQAGGHLEVDSGPERGTAFHVFLPRAPAPDAVATAPPVAPRAPGDGRALAEELRRRGRIDVLYVSGYTEEVTSHRGVLDAGVHFLAKPCTSETLLSQVGSVLDAAGHGG